MSFLDFIVYILGVYGLAWLLVHSVIFSTFRNNISYVDFLHNLFLCIVCTSVWVSGTLVWWYFPAEFWYTKLLLIGTTVTTTWTFANLLGDTD